MQGYFENYFSDKLNILDCKFKLPRKLHWNGHPFYYEILKTFEKLSLNNCKSAENILSMSIWFNRHLKTKFDEEISLAGFNFMKDIFPNNHLLRENFNGLRNNKIRKLKTIMSKIPQVWKASIEQSEQVVITVFPSQTVHLNSCDVYIGSLNSQTIYNWMISAKTRLPIGILRWCEEIEL